MNKNELEVLKTNRFNIIKNDLNYLIKEAIEVDRKERSTTANAKLEGELTTSHKLCNEVFDRNVALRQELVDKDSRVSALEFKAFEVKEDDSQLQAKYDSLLEDYTNLEDNMASSVAKNNELNEEVTATCRLIVEKVNSNVALRQQGVEKDSRIGALELCLRDIREAAQTRYNETLITTYKKIVEIADRSLMTKP